MAPNIKAVTQLTDLIYNKAYPAAVKEIEELKSFAQAEGFKGDLALWDLTYWSERLRESKFGYEEEELKV